MGYVFLKKHPHLQHLKLVNKHPIKRDSTLLFILFSPIWGIGLTPDRIDRPENHAYKILLEPFFEKRLACKQSRMSGRGNWGREKGGVHVGIIKYFDCKSLGFMQ